MEENERKTGKKGKREDVKRNGKGNIKKQIRRLKRYKDGWKEIK